MLKFNDKSIQGILAGTKTATVRQGTRQLPKTVMAMGTNGTQVTLVNVESVQKKLSELTDYDAISDGSASVDALIAALQKTYPGIGPDDVVSVITFHSAPPTTTQPAN